MKNYKILIRFFFLTILCLLTFFMLKGTKIHKKNTSFGSFSSKISSWPIYRGDRSFSGVSKEKNLRLPLKILWEFKSQDEIKSSPIVQKGIVFVGSNDGNLYALNTKTGKKIWKFLLDGRVEAPPFFLQKNIYIGSSEGKLYALDAIEGKLLWHYQTEDKILASCNAFSQEKNLYILASSYDNSMHCLDAKTGKILWKYKTESYIHGCAVLWGKDKAIFGGCDAHLHIVSLQKGKSLGKVKLAAYIGASPCVEGNLGFVGHYSGGFVCVDLLKQKILWEYKSSNKRTAFLSSCALAKDFLFVGAKDGILYCLDKKKGQKKWIFPTKDSIDTSPVVWEDKVVFGSSDGRLYIVSQDTGKKIASYEIGPAITTSPAIAESKIFIGCDDGNLYALGNAD